MFWGTWASSHISWSNFPKCWTIHSWGFLQDKGGELPIPYLGTFWGRASQDKPIILQVHTCCQWIHCWRKAPNPNLKTGLKCPTLTQDNKWLLWEGKCLSWNGTHSVVHQIYWSVLLLSQVQREKCVCMCLFTAKLGKGKRYHKESAW